MWKSDVFHPFHFFPFIPWHIELLNSTPTCTEDQLDPLRLEMPRLQKLSSDEDSDREKGGKENSVLCIPNSDHLKNSEENNLLIENNEKSLNQSYVFPPIDIVRSVAGGVTIRPMDERFMNAGLDNGDEFTSHTKTRTVNRSPCKEINISEKETTDVVKRIGNGNLCSQSQPFRVINPPRFCQNLCPHDTSHVYSNPSSGRNSLHKGSCRGSSPCPTRSPCSSPISSMGDELSSVPTNPLWTSFRDRYIDDQDESRTSDASQSLLREIRRLRRMNDEAMSLLTALQTPGVSIDNCPPISSAHPRTRHPRYLSFKERGQSPSQEQCRDKSDIPSGGAISMTPELESVVNRLMDNITSELNTQIRSKVIAGILDYLRQNPQLMQQIKKPESNATGNTEANPVV